MFCLSLSEAISDGAPLLPIYMMQFQHAFILKLDPFPEVELRSGQGSELLKVIKILNHL